MCVTIQKAIYLSQHFQGAHVQLRWDDPAENVYQDLHGQTGDVRFLATPIGTAVKTPVTTFVQVHKGPYFSVEYSSQYTLRDHTLACTFEYSSQYTLRNHTLACTFEYSSQYTLRDHTLVCTFEYSSQYTLKLTNHDPRSKLWPVSLLTLWPAPTYFINN